MISLLTIKEEACGRIILLRKIPWLPSADMMNIKVSFGLLILKQWRGKYCSFGSRRCETFQQHCC